MRPLFWLCVLLLLGPVAARASLHSGLVVAYDQESRVFTVQLGTGKEDLVFMPGSDSAKVESLHRIFSLWYLWVAPDGDGKGVTLMERPKIKVMVEYAGPTPPTRFGQMTAAPLSVTLREWNIQLPITLSTLSDEKGFEFFVLDDPAVAFAGVLGAAEQKQHVTIDQAAVEECRKKKARWIARGWDAYHFVTADLLDMLAKTKRPNQPSEPTAFGRGSP